MNILAIESSCDDTAAAVVRDGRQILSSVVASQVPEHVLYGGVVPEIASRRHVEAISGVVRQTLAESGCGYADLDAVAVTYAPGLIGALLVGVNYAKGLAFSAGLPLTPVHHLRSHIAANYLTHPELQPPFLALVVSGGHSHIVLVEDYTTFRVIGRTRDDAAGECMDKAARAIGLPYPGGLHLDKAAVGGNPKAFRFPKPTVSGSAYDFSFSGLKTSAVNLLHNAAQKGEQIPLADFGASYIAAVVRCLADNTIRAMEDFAQTRLVLAGGVSANSVLRREFGRLCRERGWQLYMPALHLCGDNAAMVGAQGYYEFLSGKRADTALNARATMGMENG